MTTLPKDIKLKFIEFAQPSPEEFNTIVDKFFNMTKRLTYNDEHYYDYDVLQGKSSDEHDLLYFYAYIFDIFEFTPEIRKAVALDIGWEEEEEGPYNGDLVELYMNPGESRMDKIYKYTYPYLTPEQKFMLSQALQLRIENFSTYKAYSIYLQKLLKVFKIYTYKPLVFGKLKNKRKSRRKSCRKSRRKSCRKSRRKSCRKSCRKSRRNN